MQLSTPIYADTVTGRPNITIITIIAVVVIILIVVIIIIIIIIGKYWNCY